MINLKDLKLNDLIKIALTATAIIALTFNLSVLSNNTTTINNYINQTNEKLNALGNSTELSNKEIISIIKKILREVD